MSRENKIDKTFGPVGSMAGIIIFFTASAATILFYTGRNYELLAGTIVALIGAFAGFTSSRVLIDPENKRIRFFNNIFGVIRVGKWISVEPQMKIGISSSKRLYRSYSRGNRILDITSKRFIVLLLDKNSRPIVPLGAADKEELALKEAEILSENLGLPQVHFNQLIKN